MRFLSFIFILSALLFTATAEAANVKRLAQDVKLPTQAVLEHETITTPIVATTNYIKDTYAGPTSAAAVTLTTFAHQPDVARNLTITPTGTTGDVEACVITVTGTGINGNTITEDFTFAANDAVAQTGNKAFKTISSVKWAADCESGGFAATWIIGVGSKLGVKRCAANAGAYAFSIFNGAYETTRGTFAADADEAEKNTFIPNGTMDGAKDVEVFYVQNFGCYY